ncbi:MAG: UPF0755 protein [Patiriisocius sp.]
MFLVLCVFVGYYLYDQVYLPTNSESSETVDLVIPAGATIDSLGDLLKENDLIRNQSLFKFIANQKKYSNGIKPGKYKVRKEISINDLINQLRLGKANDVNFTFNNIFSFKDLAGRAGQVMAPDSIDFLEVLEDKSLMDHYGFTKENYPTMFIPNTYAFKQNTNPENFVKRMATEFGKFWNEDRTNKRKALNLTQSEIVTLASIVQAEQQAIPDEWKRIAGLYLNRVRKGIPLQSDPTVKFAVGDWSIKRVLTKHLKTESPYNTYKVPGLPPGPILFPDIGAVDAVLNAEKHSYYYMCAKADFSGRHEFAKNLSLHNKYAAAYRKALNERRIYN